MWVLDPAPGAKYSEVTDIWLLASKELIRCLVQKLVKINTIDCMACSINGFRPEFSWGLVFISIVLAISMSVLFLRSTTPFCYGMYGAENSCVMPKVSRYVSRPVFLNSMPLSLLMCFILAPKLFIARLRSV